jgi:hypothetical protein
MPERSGLMNFKKSAQYGFLDLFLFVLRLVVYSKSSFLAKVLLSLYGLIHSVAVVPRNRLSGVKSLLRYGVEVIQQRLGSNSQGSVYP